MKLKLTLSGSDEIFTNFFIFFYKKFFFSYFFLNSDKILRNKKCFNFLKKIFILNNYLFFQFFNIYYYNNLNYYNNFIIRKLLIIKIYKFINFNYSGIFKENFLIRRNNHINIHSSFLPLWIGSNPLEFSLFFLNNFLGLTFIILRKKIDKGEIIINFKFIFNLKLNINFLIFKINFISILLFKKNIFLNIIKKYNFIVNQKKFFIFFSKKCI